MHMDKVKPRDSYGESCFSRSCSKRYRAMRKSHGTEYAVGTQTKEWAPTSGETTRAAKGHVFCQGTKMQ